LNLHALVLERLPDPKELARKLFDDWQGRDACSCAALLLDLLTQRGHAEGSHTRTTRLQSMRGLGEPCGVVGSGSHAQGLHTPRRIEDELCQDLTESPWVFVLVQFLQRGKRRCIERG
jgi:hypothetical protein